MEAPQVARIVSLPEGPRAVRETLKIMRYFSRLAKRDPDIRAKAASIVETLPGKAFAGEVVMLFYWVQQNVRFIMDTTGIEVLQTPAETLRARQGDCDDLSLLLSGLLESIGHRTAFRAVGFTPDSLTHVYVLTYLQQAWWPLDPSVPEPPGWEPPGVRKSLLIYN
jgi:transglutaminase-like putative cysteine protease